VETCSKAMSILLCFAPRARAALSDNAAVLFTHRKKKAERDSIELCL
jgi:hypothetical protein